MAVPWCLWLVAALLVAALAALALYFWVIESTVDGEADPYQSRPRQPRDQDGGNWRY